MSVLLPPLLLGTAHAQDFIPMDVDMSELPDLLEAMRSPGPVMGECPLGMDGDATLAPADHLLHLGTTGFYLDYEKRLDLDAEQVEVLEGIRNDALARGAALDAQLAANEASLWALTGEQGPDAAAITTTAQEIEALNTERRLLYIDAISRAAAVLRPEQVATLVGG